MNSLTKNEQNKETISQMIEKYFVPLRLEDYQELTEGYFNMAYEIRLSNGQEVILKIAPSQETRVMTYENNIMFSEVQAMGLAACHEGIPVPMVIGYDDSCTLCNSPYFFMEKLKGNSLNAVKDELKSEQVDHIYVETGDINKRINDISCPAFGYPGQPDFQGKQWYPVFKKMMEAGLKDPQRGNVDLKIPLHQMWHCLDRDQALFDEVTEPKLVHWDCWDGNIFIHDGKVSGIIDWERSLWGDPLMEVGFRTYSDNACFKKGYGIEFLTEKQMQRALWYDIYLLILVSLEYEYRKYETMDTYHWSTQLLEEQFEKVKRCKY